MSQRNLILFAIIFLAWPIAHIAAQEAPAPHRLPRIPVSRQDLAAQRQITRDITGAPFIIDAEKFRIGNIEMRLFGIVPPQLSASFGPQARAALDALAAGNPMHCQIRDRDHDAHFLATCRNAGDLDPALELLKRGLAVAARGSLADTELAVPYIAAEQAAQTQKIGLWSTAPAVAMSAPIAPVSTPIMPATRVEAAVAKTEPVSLTPAPAITGPVSAEPKKDKVAMAPAPVTTAVDSPASSRNSNLNFFAQYQLLLTGLVMLVTALGISGVLFVQRRIERREEMQALAAALRGELMAARALCQGRLKTIMTEADDRLMVWPRIRSTLYQGYVSRIGWLGAELARQIASLYGQSNDYAAYYHPADAGRMGNMPKRHALQTMVQHIEEVLPKLAVIEETGQRPQRRTTSIPSLPASSRQAPQTIHLESTPLPVASLAAPVSPQTPDASDDARHKAEKQILAPAPKAEVFPDPKVASPDPVDTEVVKTPSPLPSTRPEPAVARTFDLNPVTRTPAEPIIATAPSSTASPLSTSVDKQVEASGATSPSSVPLWDAVRKFARDHMPEKHSPPVEEIVSDYTSMIEEDMTTFTFGESDYDYGDDSLDEPLSKFGGNGRN